MKNKELASYLDYTYLKNDLTRKQLNEMINKSVEYNFYGLCIRPNWISYARERLTRLKITNLKLITVPNFVIGGGLAQCDGITDMVCEIADEIDFIWNPYNYSDLKDWDKVKEELATIRKYTKGTLKIIIEAYYLRKMDNNVYKLGLKRVFKEACKLVKESGSDFIKSDSGLYKRPDFETLVEDVKLMKKYSKSLPLKAAGGITTLTQVKRLIDLGVARIGTSSAVEIVKGDNA